MTDTEWQTVLHSTAAASTTIYESTFLIWCRYSVLHSAAPPQSTHLTCDASLHTALMIECCRVSYDFTGYMHDTAVACTIKPWYERRQRVLSYIVELFACRVSEGVTRLTCWWITIRNLTVWKILLKYYSCSSCWHNINNTAVHSCTMYMYTLS